MTSKLSKEVGMKASVFFFMVFTMFLCSGCKKETTRDEQLPLPKSEYVIKGNSKDILKRIKNKYNECYTKSKPLSQVTTDTNCIEITNHDLATTQSICAEDIPPATVRTQVVPQFDTMPMSKRSAEVFRMAIFDEAGCPQ